MTDHDMFPFDSFPDEEITDAEADAVILSTKTATLRRAFSRTYFDISHFYDVDSAIRDDAAAKRLLQAMHCVDLDAMSTTTKVMLYRAALQVMGVNSECFPFPFTELLQKIKTVADKYSVGEYAIIYLGDRSPSRIETPGKCYCVEEIAGCGLYKNEVGLLNILDTEAEAFEFRQSVGGEFPVLVFYDQSLSEWEAEEIEGLLDGPCAAVEEQIEAPPENSGRFSILHYFRWLQAKS
jgi:hypothetical protein